MAVQPTAAGHMSAAKGASLELLSLSKKYGDKYAIQDVSLSVKPGEVMTLLGPSGSGKTTTLNAISGFNDVDSGSILMDGKNISNVPSRLRGIGMVFQNYALFPHLSVRQNVSFPLEQRKMPKAERERRVAEALATVRLSGFEDRKPAQLSGGQQQRVALARAIVFEPGLLLMDEPLGALDRGLRESMQAEIRRIHRELGSTVILVTHDQEEALALSDRIAVFNHGEIQQVGTGEELYAKPQSLFVATFLGESTVLKLSRTSGGLEFAGSVVAADDSSLREPALVIRPEHARIVRTVAELPSGAPYIRAHIIDDVYLGSNRRTSVDLGEQGAVGIVRDLRATEEKFDSGDEVFFTWVPGEAMLQEAATN